MDGYNYEMKKKALIYMACIMAGVLCRSAIVLAADAQPRTSWEQEVRQDAQAAEKEIQKVGQEIKHAESDLANPAATQQEQAKQNAPGQTAKKKTLPEVQRSPVVISTVVPNPADPRAQALQGTPETGYAGTWKDPATGDIITSVIAPAPRPDNTQTYPMLIEPVVNGSDWYSGSDTWNPILNGSNSGWQPSGWPQWPGYPGDPGYMPPPPPHAPRPVPPGVPPNQPYNPTFPTHNPYNPSWTPFPPPEHPGYRPLRPNNPSVWKPGQPGFNPQNPAWRPAPPPSKPGFGHGPYPAAPAWRPNTPPPPNPGFGTSPQPGFRPLPMRPGGQTWSGGFSGSQRPGGLGPGGF